MRRSSLPITVVRQMFHADCALERAKQPALEQRGHAMHSWHQDVGRAGLGEADITVT